MVRLVIIGIVIAVAFTLYALVDAAMTDSSRARGVPKPAWVVLIVLLPVIGGALWFTIGKGSGSSAPRTTAPDDDPRFSGTRLSEEDLDAHMRDLEERLRELDDEVFPGERGAGEDRPGPNGAASNGTASNGSASNGTASNGTSGDPGSSEPDPKDPDRP